VASGASLATSAATRSSPKSPAGGASSSDSERSACRQPTRAVGRPSSASDEIRGELEGEYPDHGHALLDYRIDDPGSVPLCAAVESCWRHVETGDATLAVDTDTTVVADRGRLQRLLENLIRNSVEHGSTESRRAERAGDSVEHGSTSNRTPSGDSEASKTPRETGEAGDSMEHGPTGGRPAADDSVTITAGDLPDGFYVADDGPGIPAADRHRVFDSGYSTTDEGTGFGLSIVRAIAEAHGWTVAVAESDAGGTRMEFTGVETA
jgi:signal transduction histidine kinase